jgi:geranylgeranyl pyrophosphate synthase
MGLFFKKLKENEDIERMLHLIEISGALERCQSVAQAQALAAVSLVDKLQCPYPLEPFKLFIRYIVDRKA